MMDFVTHFPRTSRGHDAVWVIVDQLSKSAHFLAMRMTFTLEEFYRLYIQENVLLHGVPVSIVSNQDPKFTTNFLESFQRVMETHLIMSIAFHPQTDDQSEKTIQTLEDMLLLRPNYETKFLSQIPKTNSVPSNITKNLLRPNYETKFLSQIPKTN